MPLLTAFGIFEKIYQILVLVNAFSITDMGLDIGIDVHS